MLARRLRLAMRSHLLVLGWHNVEGTWCFPSRPGWGHRGLAAQLQMLRTLANVVPLDHALAQLKAGHPLPPRAVALTFDDGYADNLQLAAPLLQRLKLPATFFLVTDFLSGAGAWWEELAWAFFSTTRPLLEWEGERWKLDGSVSRRSVYSMVSEQLKRRNGAARGAAVRHLIALLEPNGHGPDPGLLLDWSGAARLLDGGFAIGSHTTRHAILTQETAADQQRDLRSSRQLLAARLNVPIRLLAYPNGGQQDFDATTIAAAAQAGYGAAVTTMDGFNDGTTPPFTIRRTVMYPERGPVDLIKALRHAWAG